MWDGFILFQQLIEAHRKIWDIFISPTERDVYGTQSVAYKIMKYLNKKATDADDIKFIRGEEWLKYYECLLMDYDATQMNREEFNNSGHNNINDIEASKLEEV
jgi:hypothetical protein